MSKWIISAIVIWVGLSCKMPVARESQGSLFESINYIVHLCLPLRLVLRLKYESTHSENRLEAFVTSVETLVSSSPSNSSFSSDGWQVK